MNGRKNIAIVGGGLVGCLMGLYLARRGNKISIFERRPDPRIHAVDAGRSINLALSNRGIKSLEEVGLGNIVRETAIPMNGRMVHDLAGNLTFLPYGKQGQFINSISRGDLNKTLVWAAEKEGIEFFFDHRCIRTDLASSSLSFQTDTITTDQQFDAIVGADGAFSNVRMAMQLTDRFNYEQHYIEHGYKEFHIPAGTSKVLERNALHIWPRESFMLIALPNPDGSFTGTLFFPFEGASSFKSLADPVNFESFFRKSFPDVGDLITDLQEQLKMNPVSSLITIRCFPWSMHNTLLLGDASHAIVPFYGQGMNAGFEDCRILNGLLNKHNDDWGLAIAEFQLFRKPDTDAISHLAMDNFIEMRDLVADKDFQLRKKIESKIHSLYPDQWVPLYSMVTFHEDIRYSEAYRVGQKQKKIMDEVMKIPDIATTWQLLDLQTVLRQIKED
ncbi:MAG: NAD(P)/FAD-dependent oxidoreductase [Chryseolinea sp.]